MMRFAGWAKGNGPTGYSFGVFTRKNGDPQSLDEKHPLFEVLRQGYDLLMSKADKGTVAGKELHVGSTARGARMLILESPWSKLTIYQQLGRDGATISLDLPFGATIEGGADQGGGELTTEATPANGRVVV
jgi:hypothetical protein